MVFKYVSQSILSKFLQPRVTAFHRHDNHGVTEAVPQFQPQANYNIKSQIFRRYNRVFF